MRILTTSLVLLVSAGCSASKSVPIAVAAPVTPVPAAAVMEPQTTAHLPAAQPVPPESIPAPARVEYHAPGTAPEPQGVVGSQPSSTRPRPKRATVSPPQPEASSVSNPVANPVANPIVTPGATPAGSPAVEEHTAPPTLRAEEDKSLSKQQIADVLDDVRGLLKSISEQPTKQNTIANQKLSVNRIESLVRLSKQAITRDDLRQADTLARRALTLARDLKQSR